MKNAFFTLLFIFLFGNLCQIGLPWWTLAPIGAIAAFLFPLRTGAGLLAGFCGGFLLWFVAAVLLDRSNQGALSGKVGQLFLGMHGWQLLMLTGVLGGLVAALGVLSGKFTRDVFVGSKPKH